MSIKQNYFYEIQKNQVGDEKDFIRKIFRFFL
jgi:hypothetical protein